MKFNGKINGKWSKETLLLTLLAGLVLLVVAIPTKSGKQTEVLTQPTQENQGLIKDERSYEAEMEQRVRDILSHVEGVGQVDVMISLKSSEEKILRVDKTTSQSLTEESDQAGGTRKISGQELAENTVMWGNTGGQPIVEKELSPQVEGIVICAQGGGSSFVKAEISAAMEALFHIPPHKIKVLKRVE